MKKRQIVGNRDVFVRPGYYEYHIIVSDEVIAVMPDINDWDFPPTGDDIAYFIRQKEEFMVVSKENPLFCENDEELKRATYILDSLTDNEYRKIERAWNSMLKRYLI